MCEQIFADWSDLTKADGEVLVIPDGCQDLIVKQLPNEKPNWFVSALQNQTELVQVKAGTKMRGLRLRPGVNIDEFRLLKLVQDQAVDHQELANRIDSCCNLSANVDEALACLASNQLTVSGSAKCLGVNLRSLQRLLLKETNRSPNYWFMLARVRKSARMVLELSSLAEVACSNGFSDQAHMTREFTRWLGISPSRLKPDSQQSLQLKAPGYS